MANASLCRCFCGSWQEEEDRFGGVGVGVGAMSPLEQPEVAEVVGMLSYSTEMERMCTCTVDVTYIHV